MNAPYDGTPENDDTGESEVVTHAFATNTSHNMPVDPNVPPVTYAPEFDDDDSDDTGSSRVVTHNPAEYGTASYSSQDAGLDSDDTGSAHTIAAPSASVHEARHASHASRINAQVRATMLDDSDISNAQDAATLSQYGTVFDIVEAIEALVADGKTSVFSGGLVRVDRDELIRLLTELREHLPVQLERASALMREAENRLDNAQTQANAIVSASQARGATIVQEAEEQAEFLASQDNIVAIARDKARDIVHTAQQQADKLTQGANDYSSAVLTEVQTQLAKLQEGVTNGIHVLQTRQEQQGQQLRESQDA